MKLFFISSQTAKVAQASVGESGAGYLLKAPLCVSYSKLTLEEETFMWKKYTHTKKGHDASTQVLGKMEEVLEVFVFA